MESSSHAVQDPPMDLPPGIFKSDNPPLTMHASGGDDKEWLPYPEIRGYTNAFIVQDSKVIRVTAGLSDPRILLGYKKRGYGVGKYNGFGGKVEPGETPLQAAKRELEEEAGITAPLVKAGTIFFMTQKNNWAYHIDMYRADTYEGEISETDEMRPKWFRLPSSESADDDTPLVPFEEMWDSDPFWMPFLVSGVYFSGRADFVEDGQTFKLNRWWYGHHSTS